MRLDLKLVQMYPSISRSKCQRLIANGAVTLNGRRTTEKDRKINISDQDEIILLDTSIIELDAQNTAPEPIEMDLDIVYEDEYLMVVNKPRGIVVHPGSGTIDPTLVSGILYHCGANLSDAGGCDRPGIVHRIDKDTSGLLMVAKSNKIHNALKKQLSKHSITRSYIALVHGNFAENEGYIDSPIIRDPKNRIKKAALDEAKIRASLKNKNNYDAKKLDEAYYDFIKNSRSREAYTSYKVIESLNGFSLLRCTLKTGRTHQIRVHMASIGHPLVGDPLYGLKKTPWREEGQMLHAAILGFVHPVREEYLEFSVTPPEDFQKKVSKIRGRQKKRH